MREFFGFGGYQRQAEGFLSWQHLLFVTSLMVLMVLLAVILGKKNRLQSLAVKNRVMIATALLIDGLELFKIVLCCIRAEDPLNWLHMVNSTGSTILPSL